MPKADFPSSAGVPLPSVDHLEREAEHITHVALRHWCCEQISEAGDSQERQAILWMIEEIRKMEARSAPCLTSVGWRRGS